MARMKSKRCKEKVDKIGIVINDEVSHFLILELVNNKHMYQLCCEKYFLCHNNSLFILLLNVKASNHQLVNTCFDIS